MRLGSVPENLRMFFLRQQAVINKMTEDAAKGIGEETIRQSKWYENNPFLGQIYNLGREVSGIAPSQRLVGKLQQLKSPPMRPQGGYEWADYGAGVITDVAESALSAIDKAAASKQAISLGKNVMAEFPKYLLSEVGAVGVWKQPLRQYRSFILNNPKATVKEIMDGTGLTRYQVENLNELVSMHKGVLDEPLGFFDILRAEGD